MSADFNIKPVGASVAATYADLRPMQRKRLSRRNFRPTRPLQRRTRPFRRAIIPRRRLTGSQIRSSSIAPQPKSSTGPSTATSLVVRQFPDEARLRARAYLRAMDIAREDNMRRNTDLRV